MSIRCEPEKRVWADYEGRVCLAMEFKDWGKYDHVETRLNRPELGGSEIDNIPSELGRFHGGEEVGDDGFVGGGNDLIPDGDAVDFGDGVERRMLLATQDTAAESLETAGMSELATVTVT
ncbi:unnamed protein product [Camellia sinensis]